MRRQLIILMYCHIAFGRFFKQDVTVQNVTCDVTNVVSSSFARSVIECQVFCNADVKCLSTFYRSSTGTCVQCDVAYNSSAGLPVWPGTVYFLKRVTDVSDPVGTCPVTWHLFQGSCYSLHGAPLGRHDAQKACQLRSGHLVDIATIQEMSFLTKLYFSQHNSQVTTRVWIGAMSAGPPGSNSYIWTDGSQITTGYNNNNFDASRSFVWESSHCNEHLTSICEMPAQF